MQFILRLCIAATLVLAVPLAIADRAESKIEDQIGKLRSLPDNQRAAATIKLANEVQALPAGKPKLRMADELSHMVTEGDQGDAALQAVADTLAKALAETPVPAKGDQPPMPYFDLAQLVRYKHVNVSIADPLFAKAAQILENQDAAIEKADFTLTDANNKKWTLSQLRGKIVLINFWATACAPCRAEMANLDVIDTRYASQGLVILSITDDDAFAVRSFFSEMNYHPTVLFDSGGSVHKLFHVTGIPRTFVLDREGKLAGVGINQCTQMQFYEMLAMAGLRPH
ncbi:MAG: TlpA disulfide reductase family protein [Terracidiphilus sp.]|jgi:peroxiredoxin